MTSAPGPAAPSPRAGAVEVVVDARALSDASAYRGIGTYVRNVLAGLARRDDLTMRALAPAGTPLPPGVRARPTHRHAPGRLRDLEHDLLLPSDLRRAGGNVVFSPALDPPRRCALPWVQTVHDVIPLVIDDPGLAPERRRWRRLGARIRRAEAVIVPSRHSADDAIALLGLDPARVHVVHHGVDPAFHPRTEGVAADPPRILYVGEYGPRKGYEEAFEIVGRLADAGYPHRLAVAGRIAPWVRPAVDALRARARHPDRIDLLGFVDDLPRLYAGATAFLYTSRYEGFGLPVLEAMATGLPVVAFANSSVSEVVGDGGVLVADADLDAATAELARILESVGLRHDLSSRALARARAFSWERSVAEHAAILTAAAAS